MNENQDPSGCWAIIILIAMLAMSFGLGVLMTFVAGKVW